MARLSPSDLGQALDFLREAEGVNGPEPFPSELLDRLRELVGCDYVNYCELDRPRERVLLLGGCSRAREAYADSPMDAEETFWLLRHQHPVCAYQDRTNDFSARRVSDFVTQRQFNRLDFYRQQMRPYGIKYELDVGLTAPLSHTKVFLFQRSRYDFAERERLLLDLLRPHFEALYSAARDRHVLAVLEGGQESPRGVVVLGANGAIEYVGAYARELLDRYFGFDLGGRLPDAVQDWLHRESTRLKGDGALGQTATPLTVKRGDRRIVVARVRDVLVVREEVGNLTRREREILALAAEGRSNAEIAAKLWLSAGTVRIHLQHIYSKLGVGNRTAAVARLSSSQR